MPKFNTMTYPESRWWLCWTKGGCTEGGLYTLRQGFYWEVARWSGDVLTPVTRRTYYRLNKIRKAQYAKNLELLESGRRKQINMNDWDRAVREVLKDHRSFAVGAGRVPVCREVTDG